MSDDDLNCHFIVSSPSSFLLPNHKHLLIGVETCELSVGVVDQ